MITLPDYLLAAITAISLSWLTGYAIGLAHLQVKKIKSCM